MDQDAALRGCGSRRKPEGLVKEGWGEEERGQGINNLKRQLGRTRDQCTHPLKGKVLHGGKGKNDKELEKERGESTTSKATEVAKSAKRKGGWSPIRSTNEPA